MNEPNEDNNDYEDLAYQDLIKKGLIFEDSNGRIIGYGFLSEYDREIVRNNIAKKYRLPKEYYSSSETLEHNPAKTD